MSIIFSNILAWELKLDPESDSMPFLQSVEEARQKVADSAPSELGHHGPFVTDYTDDDSHSSLPPLVIDTGVGLGGRQ